MRKEKKVFSLIVDAREKLNAEGKNDDIPVYKRSSDAAVQHFRKSGCDSIKIKRDIRQIALRHPTRSPKQKWYLKGSSRSV